MHIFNYYSILLQAARQEREDIIKLLQEQEYLEKNVQDDIAEKAKSERVKKETKEALTRQMETKKRLEQERKQREAQFRIDVSSIGYYLIIKILTIQALFTQMPHVFVRMYVCGCLFHFDLCSHKRLGRF